MLQNNRVGDPLIVLSAGSMDDCCLAVVSPLFLRSHYYAKKHK